MDIETHTITQQDFPTYHFTVGPRQQVNEDDDIS